MFAVLFTPTGHVHVGSSWDFDATRAEHLALLRDGAHPHRGLQVAVEEWFTRERWQWEEEGGKEGIEEEEEEEEEGQGEEDEGEEEEEGEGLEGDRSNWDEGEGEGGDGRRRRAGRRGRQGTRGSHFLLKDRAADSEQRGDKGGGCGSGLVVAATETTAITTGAARRARRGRRRRRKRGQGDGEGEEVTAALVDYPLWTEHQAGDHHEQLVQFRILQRLPTEGGNACAFAALEDMLARCSSGGVVV